MGFMREASRRGGTAMAVSCVVFLAAAGSASVGDQVHQFVVPVLTGANHCSVGLAFDGTWLYYDRCADSNIYKVHPVTGALEDTFDVGSLQPSCLAYDGTRNGLWFGNNGSSGGGMPIRFWDFDDNSVTLEFTIPGMLFNPATAELFVGWYLCDGLAFNARNPADPSDDELWFSDDVNRNIGVFRPDGTLVNGYDATTVDPTLISLGGIGGNSGLAIGGDRLYLGNNGHGDVFIADATADPLTLVSQFLIGDERQEDMACDQITFPVPVLWVRTTPQGGTYPDVITAYQIDKGNCVMGGLGTIFVAGFEMGDTSEWSGSAP